METLKGLPVANAINEKIIEEMKDWKGAIPHLAIVRVGERPDDMSYERGATKKMEKVGFRCTSYTFPADIDNDTFQKEFDKINEDEDIDGILLLRPLPKHLDEKAIENRIASVKDLDGISPMNLAKVYAGDPTGYGPCTAEAVIEMLDYAGVDLKGKRAVVIGRSLVIGKPVAMMLMKKNATVTVCHTKTVDMPGVCKGAEVLVAAAGVAKMVDKSFVADGAVVIGSSSSDDLTVEVDDSALDTKGDNINWYFADEAEFDKSNITVMSGDKDVTADADIKFDSTPGKTYNGKTFDYTVSYTATYGGKNATGTVDVKIGLRGDADCSHKVDARDAAAIAKDLAQLYGSKKTTLTKKNGEFALFLANVDEGVAKKETTWYGKRDINARDAARIAEYLSKKFKNPNLELVDLVKK